MANYKHIIKRFKQYKSGSINYFDVAIYLIALRTIYVIKLKMQRKKLTVYHCEKFENCKNDSRKNLENYKFNFVQYEEK